ncbi:hypothetical protein, partial [Vibrio splendidus]|uniref:hypothetical protein n=1 Tax=Vibrio splendidus TaxID=29497 RepID=UPI001A7E07FC
NIKTPFLNVILSYCIIGIFNTIPIFYRLHASSLIGSAQFATLHSAPKFRKEEYQPVAKILKKPPKSRAELHI